MSQQVILDCQKFARERAALTGSVSVAELARLHDQLFSTAGELAYELRAEAADNNSISWFLNVQGSLQLVCQRCLEPVPFAIEIDSHLVMAPEDAEISQDELEDDSLDYLPLEKTLNVFDLVEDEVILALPVAAKHDQCGLQGQAEAGDSCSPFAALATLKKAGHN